MRRMLGAYIANWLRKPENRAKAKRTADQLWSRFQQRKGSRNVNSDTRKRP